MSDTDPEIQFGEVEQTRPQSTLRPDRNRHLTVTRVYRPGDEDLRIFVDIDAMREMELHASSDTHVELGGVLLGGQYADESGRPFVVITDCLRAQHYESTKGSFKFTHDTWEQITREREDFPAELQMVGWYHTHPDWGVFLSSLDMFICENFFNKPLDVALVIDPCRQDRGFFQWTKNDASEIRRTDGFYLTASRFRSEELFAYAAQLESQMTPETRHVVTSSGHNTPPVVHVVAPGNSAPQLLAILGMLSLQFFVLMLLAWKLIGSPFDASSDRSDVAAIQQGVERLAEMQQQEAEVDAKLQVLEMVVRQATDAPEGILKSLADQTARGDELQSSLRAQQSLARELEAKAQTLTAELEKASRRDERQTADIAELESKVASLSRKLETSRAELVKAQEGTDDSAETSEWSFASASSKDLGLGALLGALFVGAVFAVALHLKKSPLRNPSYESDPQT